MTTSTSTALSSSAVASALAPNSNLSLSDTNNNNENDTTYSYIASLRKLEEQCQFTDYIKIKKSKDKHIIDGNCRARVCRWMFDLVDSLNMSRDTAVAAICNLDRFMSATKKATFDKKEYQLGKYSIVLSPRGTSRYISIKLLYSTRFLMHSTVLLSFILFVSDNSSKHHCNSYCHQSLRDKRGRCLSTKSTLSWIAVCKRYRTIRA